MNRSLTLSVIVAVSAVALSLGEPYRISCSRGGQEIHALSTAYTRQLDGYYRKLDKGGVDYDKGEAAQEFAQMIAQSAQDSGVRCSATHIKEDLSLANLF